MEEIKIYIYSYEAFARYYDSNIILARLYYFYIFYYIKHFGYITIFISGNKIRHLFIYLFIYIYLFIIENANKYRRQSVNNYITNPVNFIENIIKKHTKFDLNAFIQYKFTYNVR